jgi:hypothetical protein
MTPTRKILAMRNDEFNPRIRLQKIFAAAVIP